MKPGELDLLMQSVLDGEASKAETIALGTHLAADPEARKRFEAVRWIFNELSKVPQEQPPAGFTAAVMAKVPVRETRPGLPVQLFWKSIVLGMTSHPPGRTPGQPATDPRPFAPGPFTGERNMSQQENKSRRNLWIGGGVAAAAAIIGVAQFTDFPRTGESTSGTIVPAQRHRAAQPTAGDVKLGAPTQGGSQQQVGVVGASNQAASNNSSANATNQAAGQVANEAANKAAEQASNDARSAARNQAAGQVANEAANKAASANASANAANKAAEQASNDARSAARNQAAGQVANEAANKAASANASANAANKAAEQASNDARSAARNQAAGQVANEAANKAANKAASTNASVNAANQAASQAANEAANKAAAQAAQRAAAPAANEAMKK